MGFATGQGGVVDAVDLVVVRLAIAIVNGVVRLDASVVRVLVLVNVALGVAAIVFSWFLL